MSDTDAIEQLELDDNFKHSPLNLKSREVRLLKLVPGSENKEHVHAVIQHFDLSEAPPFKALSYTWGQAHPLFSVYINGKPFSVRQNLSAFLQTVGSDPELCTDAWLWIDQVCIQQANVDERNHQVRQMAEIYRSASEVIVWLGPGTTYSKSLLREAAEVKDNLTSWSNLTTRAVVQLLGCEYWTRTWVIQEFILAPSMVLCWGTTKFGFDDLEMILKIGCQRIRDRHCQAHSLLQKITQIAELMSQKSISRHDGFMIRNWKNALTLSSFTNCQDVRDRIYALLGLVDPKIAISPNYAASPGEIFVDVLAGVAVQYSNRRLEVGEKVDFLATKALVSRALGLGNRPLDELSGVFFFELRNDNQHCDNACIDSLNYQECRAKAANALRAWIVEDNKHIFGLQVESIYHWPIENADNEYGRTPLSWAAEKGHETVVKLLLGNGADLESNDFEYGRTPLSWAAEKGHETVVKLLLGNGADLESNDFEYGRTPLSWAAEKGHETVVKLLLEKGADLESKDFKYSRTPLSWAAEEGHETVVKLLLEDGADLESKDFDYGRTPLSWAAEEGHETVVKLLLEKGANLESKDENRQTPLSRATYKGHEAVVKLLLEKHTEIRHNF